LLWLKTGRRTTLLVTLFFIVASNLFAQVPGFSKPRFIPKGPYQFDTADVNKSVILSKETANLLDKEIDASTYVLGPGDIVTISIWTTESQHQQIAVTPEGKLIIPRAGIISVKGLTLDSAQKLITMEAQKVYRNAKIDVSLSALRRFKVFVLGAVSVPSVVPATGADRVFDALERAGGILDTGSVRKITIVREGASQPVNVDLERYISYGDNSGNPLLLSGDRIVVPFRSHKSTVGIYGEVVKEREFEYLESDSVSTLIRLVGGFLPTARTDSVRLVRLSGDGSRLQETILDLTDWTENLNSSMVLPGDFPLEVGDRIYVRSRSNWNVKHDAVISGEVRFPGRYPLIPNVTKLTDLIEAAGGFTDKASLEDAVILRTSEMNLLDKEFERLRLMPPSEMSVNELQYYKVKSREVKGVISVDFVDVFVRDKLGNNPTLRDGDSINVPERNNYVNVTGSVRNPGRVVYKEGLAFLDYVRLAGGYGFRADQSATLVVKPKGDQFPASSENYKMEPGDNILVLDTPETRFIDVFTKVLTITAQIVTIVGVVLAVVRLK